MVRTGAEDMGDVFLGTRVLQRIFAFCNKGIASLKGWLAL